LGNSAESVGVYGSSTASNGVSGFSTNSYGVVGRSTNDAGVAGLGTSHHGVLGASDDADGVRGQSTNASGVFGVSTNGPGVYGRSFNNYAGYFEGNIRVNGEMSAVFARIDNYVSGGSAAVCANTSNNRIGVCSSSLRYKTGVQSFAGGLDIVRRLRPITFNWTDSGLPDLGFGAEEVERVEPLLTIRNPEGEIEGVKYGQLTTVLVNAIREQQAQVDELRRHNGRQAEQIERLRGEIGDLRRLVCRDHPEAEMCTP
jgi:hypothetical protein